jgi:7-keto-8-aminopelargonate synthetase-like enzyme
MLSDENPYAKRTKENAAYFRKKMQEAGFDLIKGDTAIIAVMIYDEAKAVEIANELLAQRNLRHRIHLSCRPQRQGKDTRTIIRSAYERGHRPGGERFCQDREKHRALSGKEKGTVAK